MASPGGSRRFGAGVSRKSRGAFATIDGSFDVTLRLCDGGVDAPVLSVWLGWLGVCKTVLDRVPFLEGTDSVAFCWITDRVARLVWGLSGLSQACPKVCTLVVGGFSGPNQFRRKPCSRLKPLL